MTNFPKSILEEKYFRYLFPSLTFLVSIFLWVRADTMFWHPDSMVSASLRLLKSGEFTTYWATYGPASYFAASIGAAFIAALGFVLSAWKSFPEFEDSYRLNSIDVLGKAMTFDHFSLIWNLLLFSLSVYFLYKSLNVIKLNKINYLIALTSMIIFPIHYYQVTIPTVEVYLILGVTVLLYSFIRSYFLNDFGIFQFLRFFVAFQLTLGIRFTLLLLVFPLIVLLMHKNFQEKEQLKRQITSFVLLLTLTSVPYILVLKSEENRRQVFELTAGLASLDISAQNVFENFAIFSTNFSLIGLGLVAIFLFTKIKFRNSREARFNSLLKLLMVIQFATYITNVNGFSKYLVPLFVVTSFFLAFNFQNLFFANTSISFSNPRTLTKWVLVILICIGSVSDYQLASRTLPDTRQSLSVMFQDKKNVLDDFEVSPSIPAEFSRGKNGIPFESSIKIANEVTLSSVDCKNPSILSDRDLVLSELWKFSTKCLTQDPKSTLISISPHRIGAALVDSDSWQSLLSLGHKSDEFRIGYGPTFFILLPSTTMYQKKVSAICLNTPLCKILDLEAP